MSREGRANRTERLLIEELCAEHAIELFEPLSDPRLYRFIGQSPSSSVDELRARFTRLAAGSGSDELWKNWVVWSADRKTSLGTLQATIEAPDALIAYMVFPPFWRRGFAREAVGWLLDELQRNSAIKVAKASVDTENVASIRLLTALGFELIETRFEADTIPGHATGELRDEHWFARETTARYQTG